MEEEIYGAVMNFLNYLSMTSECNNLKVQHRLNFSEQRGLFRLFKVVQKSLNNYITDNNNLMGIIQKIQSHGIMVLASIINGLESDSLETLRTMREFAVASGTARSGSPVLARASGRGSLASLP